MTDVKKLRFPGFYVKVVDKAAVSNPKGWRSSGKRIQVTNATTNPRDNDIAEVVDIDVCTDNTKCFLCRDIDGFMFVVDDVGVEFFAKDWPDAAERIKVEFKI